MEKKQIILPKLRYANAPETDSQLRVGLDEEKSLLRTDDRDIILNLSEQFATERADSKKYKLYGKLKMVFKNLYLGTAAYPYLRERLFLLTDGSDNCFAGYLPYDEFGFIRQDVYREIITNDVVNTLYTFTGFTLAPTGSTYHQIVTTTGSTYFNWNIYLSYVYSGSTTFPMKYTLSGSTLPLPSISFTSGDGIPFRVEDAGTEYILTSPVKHGIKQGEYIIISGRTTPFYVNSVGNAVYRSEDYVINILKTQVSGSTLNTVVLGKRCTDINDVVNSTSQYYVHKHKTLTRSIDCTLDKMGFESPIWEDEKKLLYENSVGANDVLVVRNRMESILFDFTNPFILTGITNNLGYTPTDVYATIIFKNSNGYFDYPPKVGYSFHFHDSWVDTHFSGLASQENTIGHTHFSKGGFNFIKGDEIFVGTVLNGAFVEYNPKEMKERIISEAFHKIVADPLLFNHGQALSTTYSGATSSNPIGLYYQPHYRFKLRELSPYTETSNTNNVDNLPENAKYFPNEKLWRWRDLYDDGYIDTDGYGTDYPYLNDIHYVHQDINFYLRNEYVYTNKKDGLIDFYKSKNINKC